MEVSNKRAMALVQESNKQSKKALRKVSAKVVEVNKANKNGPVKSQSLPEDPFDELTKSHKILAPPFDLLTLSMLPENNTEMIQCIDAMVVNIGGYGHRFVPRIKKESLERLPENLKNEILIEKIKLENFFMYATRESFTRFRSKQDRDLEVTGNAYMEIIRSNNSNVQSFTHLPSYQMRLGTIDDEPRLVKRKILELQSDLSVKVVEIQEYRRFRKFVQSRIIAHGRAMPSSGKVAWFKEFGDDRNYHSETGEEIKKGSNVPVDKYANEVLHRRIYTGRSPYGLPRYIGNLLSIFGDRAAEEINFITFKNNNIPSMVVAVSNGQLTESTIDRMKEFVESQIQGSDNYSKFLIIEAEGLEEGEDGGQVKLDIKPLTEEQHSDALFQNYSKNNQDKVRRVWRLPPIFVGRSDDYSRSTAETSRRLADEQIFAPERDEFDSIVNRVIFPEMGIRYHKFKSNSPNTTDNTQLVKILSNAEKTGGMTPAIGRMILEDVLNAELPSLSPEIEQDIPFSLTMAEAVKNQADPTEPGQQVTAIKSKTGDPLVDHILTLQEVMQEQWDASIFKTSEED